MEDSSLVLPWIFKRMPAGHSGALIAGEDLLLLRKGPDPFASFQALERMDVFAESFLNCEGCDLV